MSEKQERKPHRLTDAQKAKAHTGLTPQQLAQLAGGDAEAKDFTGMTKLGGSGMQEIKDVKESSRAGHVNAAGMSVGEDGEEIGAAALLKNATSWWEKLFGKRKSV